LANENGKKQDINVVVSPIYTHSAILA